MGREQSTAPLLCGSCSVVVAHSETAGSMFAVWSTCILGKGAISMYGAALLLCGIAAELCIDRVAGHIYSDPRGLATSCCALRGCVG